MQWIQFIVSMNWIAYLLLLVLVMPRNANIYLDSPAIFSYMEDRVISIQCSVAAVGWGEIYAAMGLKKPESKATSLWLQVLSSCLQRCKIVYFP